MTATPKRNRAEGALPGPRCRITHGPNTRTYETIIDESGRVRFPLNRIVAAALDTNAINLNRVAVCVAEKLYSKVEQRELQRLIGYSISGYAELWPRAKIELKRDGQWEEV